MAEGGTTLLGAVGKWGLAAISAAVLSTGLTFAIPAEARSSQPPVDVALDTLPTPARETYRLILQGGPFPYRKDGSVFGNRERLLPQKHRGYYREYTVKTPGSSDRGARRIVCGGEQPTSPDACYYTADHYASFARIQAR